MRKTISVLAAIAMAAALPSAVFAADKTKNEPDVFVGDSKILFQDQNAVIVNGVTLVPARGVFEAMGCDVDWDEKARKVTVTSDTGVREVYITIDSDIMTVGTFESLMKRNDVDKTLEVPAQIMNDRTMIPLRAVSEAMDCTVDWDQDAYVAKITKGERILLKGATPKAKTPESEMLKMSLSMAEDKEVAAGDEFTVYVDAANVPDKYYMSAIVASFAYDHSKLQYVEGSGALLNNNDEAYEPSVFAENPEYDAGAKVVFINIDESKGRTTSGHVFKASFKKLTDEAAELALSNNYDTILTYESYFQFTTLESSGLRFEDKIFCGDDMIVDKTPLVID